MPPKIINYNPVTTTELPPKHAILVFAAWCPHSTHILSVLKKCKLQVPLYKVDEKHEMHFKNIPDKLSGFPRLYIKKGTKYIKFGGNRTVLEMTNFINT